MTNPFAPALATSIQTHFEQLGQECASLENLHWILKHWSLSDCQKRQLGMSDLRPIEKLIKTIPTGKRRHYQKALNDLLFYLQDALQWIMPEEKQTSLRDTEYEWFESMACGSQKSKQLFELYQSHKEHYFTKRGALSPIFITLMIGFDIAPLSLRHICQILNHSDSIRFETSKPCLRVHHLINSKGEDRHFHTHYHLPLLSYRLLQDYYGQSPAPVTVHNLYNQLTLWLNSHAQPPARLHTWSQLFQISWYVRHHLPPTLIKDLAFPERHVSLPYEVETSKLNVADIYAIDWDLRWFDELTRSKYKTRWPHRNLISSYGVSKTQSAAPARDPDNLLPNLLYEYTEQLLTFGGAKKSTLALSSITKYTGLQHILEPHPLPYADASNEESVNLWAQKVYDTITVDSTRQSFVYFLRFLSVHEQTDGIDLTLFSSPTLPPSVSPSRLDLAQLDTLIHALITNNTTHPFRSLFSIIATLLGFFGMLRRGEVLRLRCRDIQFVPKTGLLTLTVTNTSEGRTKNGQTRQVYTTIPKQYRKFFQALLSIKNDTSSDCPLLGFEGEKYHSRQLYYLLPISRALKILFGTHMNFHHLRHSGVHLFMIQVLHYVSLTPTTLRGRTPLEQEMLSDKAISTRFEYWFEGRGLRDVNDGIFLDEICAQIGHTHYATTRWSYLHDIDWLLPIISRAHQDYIQRGYTHAELRYLFGLLPKSNDLSRRLKLMSANYAQLSLSDKRNKTIKLSESELRTAILGQPVKQNTPIELDHFKEWQNSIHTSTGTLLGFLFKSMMLQQSLKLLELSQIWSLGCQHDIHPIDKKQRTAFRNLPPIQLSDDGRSLQIVLACNIKNARAFTAAFRHKHWKWLAFDFELTMNRKLNKVRQLALIQKYYTQAKERVDVLKCPKGQTTLRIQLSPKTSLSKQTLTFIYQFITLLQSTQDTNL